MISGPNLARAPFINRRPIHRLTVLCALAALLLTVVNIWNYWGHFAGRGRQQGELAQLEEQTATERSRLAASLKVLDGFDLDWQTEQITFLNAKIAERTFAWSALFDHLAEVLPRAVRIERVTPRLAGSGRHNRGRELRQPGDAVALELAGAAEQDEALLELVDAFFAHDRFRRPNLRVETRDDAAKNVGFSMGVTYVPAPMPAVERDALESAETPQEASEPPRDEDPIEGADDLGATTPAEVES